MVESRARMKSSRPVYARRIWKLGAEAAPGRGADAEPIHRRPGEAQVTAVPVRFPGLNQVHRIPLHQTPAPPQEVHHCEGVLLVLQSSRQQGAVRLPQSDKPLERDCEIRAHTLCQQRIQLVPEPSADAEAALEGEPVENPLPVPQVEDGENEISPRATQLQRVDLELGDRLHVQGLPDPETVVDVRVDEGILDRGAGDERMAAQLGTR